MPGMTVGLLLILLGLLGVVSAYTLGKFLHPMLVYLWLRSLVNRRE
jgi:hypothetical protein